VRNEEELKRVMENRNILHTVHRRKANWMCHILRMNCLLKMLLRKDRGKDKSGGKTRKKK